MGNWHRAKKARHKAAWFHLYLRTSICTGSMNGITNATECQIDRQTYLDGPPGNEQGKRAREKPEHKCSAMPMTGSWSYAEHTPRLKKSRRNANATSKKS